MNKQYSLFGTCKLHGINPLSLEAAGGATKRKRRAKTRRSRYSIAASLFEDIFEKPPQYQQKQNMI